MRALATTFLIFSSLSAAHADEPPEVEASRHFGTGQKAFNDGDYTAAIAEFTRAYQLVPHPDVLIDIAISHERMYQPDLARDKYEQFLKDAPDSPEEATKRMLAQNRLRVLRSLPGKILVGTSKPGASVHLTGEGIDKSGLVTPIPPIDGLPPGKYKIHIELGYHVPQDIEVPLDPGGQAVVNVQLEHQVETLTVFSRPDGARVFLDDREEGVTPFSRPIDVGLKRRLRVESEDFPSHAEEIDVVAGHPVRRDIVFRRPFRSGRSELVLGSMIYGAAGSVFITEAAMGCSSGCGVAPGVRLGLDLGATVVGVGVGFLVSSLTTDDHVKVGHSSIIIGGTVWGTTIATSLAFGLRLSDQDVLAVALLGSALGIASGLITARVNDTSPGDAAIVNSGGTWGSMTGLLMATALDVSADSRTPTLGWLTLSGCALGLVAGSFLAWNIEVSRGHVAVVDVAGLAGLALAFAVGYGVAPTSSDTGATDHLRLVTGSRYGLGGMVVGLLAGAILSRKYKDDLPPTEALVTHHGKRWAFGLPEVQVTPSAGPDGRDTRVLLNLARGDF